MRWLCLGLAAGRAAVVLASVAASTALIGGCASSGTEAPAAQVAAQPPTPRTEMEDDGLPAQVAPSRRVRQLPDDPAEPFSPNYGPRPLRPPLPPMRLSSAEENAIIMRAIVAHEMRRP
jgi:hypothetical protein